MNRRKALKNIGFSLGAVSATPTLVSLLSSCQNESNWSPKLLSILKLISFQITLNL